MGVITDGISFTARNEMNILITPLWGNFMVLSKDSFPGARKFPDKIVILENYHFIRNYLPLHHPGTPDKFPVVTAKETPAVTGNL